MPKRSIAILAAAAALLTLATPGAAGPDEPPEPPWTSAQTKALVALAEEYLEKEYGTSAEKDAILERARAIGPISKREAPRVLKALFKVARSGTKVKGKGECTGSFPLFPGTYYLVGAGSRKGIFVGLHGGGPGVGDGRSAQSQWGSATGKGLIGVFPTAHLADMPYTWQHKDVEAFVIGIIRELKRTYRIDTNRIYVAGHSLGGSGAFHIGPRNADIFAGVSPNAGGCRGVTAGGETRLPGGFMANLFATPIYITHYDKDPRVSVNDSRAAAAELARLKKDHPDGYEHVYVEGEGENHGFPPKSGPSQIINWLTKHERAPYPAKIVWEPSNPRKRLFFWLRMASPPSGTSGGNRIVARIEDNRIDLEVSRPRGLSVLLAEKMFDPKRPVVVAVNGEVRYEGRPQRDPAALLECIMENIDPEQVFHYRIDL